MTLDDLMASEVIRRTAGYDGMIRRSSLFDLFRKRSTNAFGVRPNIVVLFADNLRRLYKDKEDSSSRRSWPGP
jgi:hypothetical protein